MGLYQTTYQTVAGEKLVMRRSTDNLHAAAPSTGEICAECYCWDPIWVGPAQIAGDVFRWVKDQLRNGATIDLIDEYISEHGGQFQLPR